MMQTGKGTDMKAIEIVKAKTKADAVIFWAIIGYLAIIAAAGAYALYERAPQIMMAGQ